MDPCTRSACVSTFQEADIHISYQRNQQEWHRAHRMLQPQCEHSHYTIMDVHWESRTVTVAVVATGCSYWCSSCCAWLCVCMCMRVLTVAAVMATEYSCGCSLWLLQLMTVAAHAVGVCAMCYVCTLMNHGARQTTSECANVNVNMFSNYDNRTTLEHCYSCYY